MAAEAILRDSARFKSTRGCYRNQRWQEKLVCREEKLKNCKTHSKKGESIMTLTALSKANSELGAFTPRAWLCDIIKGLIP